MVVRRGPRGPTRGGSRGTVADSPADTVEDVSGTGGGDLALDWLAGRRRVPLVWTRSGGSDTYFGIFWFSFHFCLCFGAVCFPLFSLSFCVEDQGQIAALVFPVCRPSRGGLAGVCSPAASPLGGRGRGSCGVAHGLLLSSTKKNHPCFGFPAPLGFLP